MEIKIIFDNEKINDKFSAGWGLSVLAGRKVLFDTGENAGYLFANIKNMGVSIKDIESVVISHEHWDHTGGLWELLNERNAIKVYVCPSFSREFTDKIKKMRGRMEEAGGFIEIENGIYSTGEVSGSYKGQNMPEQALVVKTVEGVNLITGCSHPGIIRMISKVKDKFPQEPINMILGGFHLMNKDISEIEFTVKKLKEMGVKKAGPAHCSGNEAKKIFKREFGKNFISVKAGRIIDDKVV